MYEQILTGNSKLEARNTGQEVVHTAKTLATKRPSVKTLST